MPHLHYPLNICSENKGVTMTIIAEATMTLAFMTDLIISLQSPAMPHSQTLYIIHRSHFLGCTLLILSSLPWLTPIVLQPAVPDDLPYFSLQPTFISSTPIYLVLTISSAPAPQPRPLSPFPSPPGCVLRLLSPHRPCPASTDYCLL